MQIESCTAVVLRFTANYIAQHNAFVFSDLMELNEWYSMNMKGTIGFILEN